MDHHIFYHRYAFAGTHSLLSVHDQGIESIFFLVVRKKERKNLSANNVFLWVLTVINR